MSFAVLILTQQSYDRSRRNARQEQRINQASRAVSVSSGHLDNAATQGTGIQVSPCLWHLDHQHQATSIQRECNKNLHPFDLHFSSSPGDQESSSAGLIEA
ncbi:hypothetical protein PR202_ga14037 [Eleusine coracana subsp. coracana]|uniref:Uncharacterized protein n=1 Tax=Eleusine coracana subsp. coracana TaxID=191504 RepID=A0AAV5CFK5_ELECO|nr:hypothetical protein PR202_ga14037 [Eleusine coracana subsp. coracana]